MNKIAFAALALLGVASGQSVGAISCETSDNSPYLSDVQQALSGLRARENSVIVQNDSHSGKCTPGASVGSAALSLCGDQGISIGNNEMADDVQQIINACRVEGDNKIGGTYVVGPQSYDRVQIYKG